MWVELAGCDAGVNQRGDEEGKFNQANEKNGGAKLEPRAESELPHFKEIFRSWVFRGDVSLSWYKRKEVLLLGCLGRNRLLLALLLERPTLPSFGGLSISSVIKCMNIRHM